MVYIKEYISKAIVLYTFFQDITINIVITTSYCKPNFVRSNKFKLQQMFAEKTSSERVYNKL